MEKKKVLVIGVDGATFDIINPLVKEGKLPTFKRLIASGASGLLNSTVPCYSPMAWTSWMKGKNPGKHGVFAFTKSRVKDPTALVEAKHNSDDVFWNIASDNGLKVCVMNVPLTYPPHEVNGIMISGFLGPGEKVNFTYPKKLGRSIVKKFGYTIDINRATTFKANKTIYFKDAINTVRRKADTAEYLLGKNSYDLFIFAIGASDRTQHLLWHTHDKNHPAYTSEYGDLIERFYIELDKQLARVIDSVGADAIFVMSDHGGEPLYYNAFLNKYLKDWNWLRLKKKKKKASFLPRKERLYKLLAKLNLARMTYKIPGILKKVIPRADSNLADCDWKNTKVYAKQFGLVYINTDSNEKLQNINKSEYTDFRRKIIQKLKTIKHNGCPVIDEIYTKEQLYSGKYLDVAPDIICVPKPTYQLHAGFAGEYISRASTKGTHQSVKASNGIFITNGRGIKKGKVNANIIDFAPTVLHYMNLPIPKETDGRILTEIFEKKPQKASYFKETKRRKKSVKSKVSKGAEEEMKARLKDLGYI